MVHPPDRVIAFPRFVPDAEGARQRSGVRFKKVYPLADRFALLRERYPRYHRLDPVFGRYLSEVPYGSVSKIYNPVQKAAELAGKRSLDRVERDALDFTSILRDSSGVDPEVVGISGSVLAGLHTPNSDVDIVAYGAENCLRVRQSAEKLLNEGLLVKRYSEGGLRGLFRFRSQDTIMPFRDFVRHERRKTIQGTFRGRDFFIRYVKGRNQVGEVYGDRVYRPGDRVTIRARITSDAESIFTPCSYKVADVEVTKGRFEGLITEITSFRGRFCEQARTEETVEASGTLERVELRSGGGMNRVLLGNDKEDFMRVVDFEHAKQL